MGRYQDALDYIFSFVNYEKPVRFGYNAETLNLGRMREFLDLLGLPHDRFRCVHIAGTKGNSSGHHRGSNALACCRSREGEEANTITVDGEDSFLMRFASRPRGETRF